MLNNYAHIFDILIRLRQAVDHPYLVIHSQSRSQGSQQVSFATETSPKQDPDCDDLQCGLCKDPAEDRVTAGCGHHFCRSCVMDYMETMTSAENVELSTNATSKRKRDTPRGLVCPECKNPLTMQLEAISTQPSSSRAESVWDSSKRRRKSILDRIDMSQFQSSTKMEALMEVQRCGGAISIC